MVVKRSGEAVLCCLPFFKSLYLINGERIGAKTDAFYFECLMKKYRRRIIPEYDTKYADSDPEFYGVFIEKNNGHIVSVKVDPKRLRKTGLIDNDMYNDIQSINRNTPYFFPAKKITEKYCFETFRYAIEGLRRLWAKEIRPAIDKLQTPQEAGQVAFEGRLADGVLEYDECEMVRTMTSILRAPAYQHAITMFYAQFALLLGSTVEAVMVDVITQQGYSNDKFNRENLKSFVSGRVPGLDYTLFDNHCYYDKIYTLWNFIKHNNIDVYNKVKERYPDFLLNASVPYKNGDSAIKYLALSEELLLDLMNGVVQFFDEFCRKVFGETTDYAGWNTEAFYVRLVKDRIEDITNPLGLPWYI